ncbi:methionyl-tRNA formyltransferase [Patescibacteria group bacterium]|nr:methionyl-tRNA formyltransferase [Patescibacteria group bacterium]MBU4057776.1 methionyl-tRNA formyltransferase [Patescibacteria group bacterium]MBU4115826.1 methionyl-tRNA formyltransferase [Patescibacteria group bacterium]
MDKNILQKNSKVLRKKTAVVPLNKIGSKKIKTIIEKMKKAVHSREDGVAIAAPQIGELLKIFVISKKAFKIISEEKGGLLKKFNDKVFINPELIRLSKEKTGVEEGCLSIKDIYGVVNRSKKATIKAYDENGKSFTMGGSGLIAQIFQHEMDHLEGVLFTDKTLSMWEIDQREIEKHRTKKNLKIVFWGTSSFSVVVLEELKKGGVMPSLIVTAPDKPKGRKLLMTPPEVKVWADQNNIDCIQPEKLDHSVVKNLEANLEAELPSGLGSSASKWDLFIVASYGKIIPKNIFDLPKYGTLNIHPSLLPKLRGASPIKTAILEDEKNTGVTIMLIDEEMDHGPIVVSKKTEIGNWPPKSLELEKKLAKEGAGLLVDVIPRWTNGEIEIQEQNHKSATYSKKIKKEDALIDFKDDPYLNYRKIQAFDDNPRAYFFVEKAGKKIRVIITDAKFENGELKILRIVPEGKKEMSYEEFQKGLK